MRKFNIRQQIGKLYLLTSVGYFQIAGASWVALLAMRGFSLLEIGMLESIFHIVTFLIGIRCALNEFALRMSFGLLLNNCTSSLDTGR